MTDDFQDNVYAVMQLEGKYALFRKLHKGERTSAERLWEDERGDLWKYLFSTEDDRCLETCIHSYRNIEMNLKKIYKIAAEGKAYGENI